jgi:hypothetical protein
MGKINLLYSNSNVKLCCLGGPPGLEEGRLQGKSIIISAELQRAEAGASQGFTAFASAGSFSAGGRLVPAANIRDAEPPARLLVKTTQKQIYFIYECLIIL